MIFKINSHFKIKIFNCNDNIRDSTSDVKRKLHYDCLRSIVSSCNFTKLNKFLKIQLWCHKNYSRFLKSQLWPNWLPSFITLSIFTADCFRLTIARVSIWQMKVHFGTAFRNICECLPGHVRLLHAHSLSTIIDPEKLQEDFVGYDFNERYYEY